MKIKTEFGLSITTDRIIDDREKICLQYPYTADLCRQALDLKGTMETVLQYRKMDKENGLGEAVTFYKNAGMQLPPLVKEIADAHHILYDSFPDDSLYLVDIKQDGIFSYYFFSGSPAGTKLRVEIHQPFWLEEDFKALWNLSHPRRIGVGLNRAEHTGSIMMEGLNLTIRKYFPEDISKAIEKRIRQLHEGNDRKQNKNIKDTPAKSGIRKRNI